MSKLIVECCRVDGVEPHPNADRLDVVLVKGWKCIVLRESFKTGDSCIFIPPDSVVTAALVERFQLGYLKAHGRVGVVKLRGEYSYGIVLANLDGHEVGQDVADFYGITKWEPPAKGDNLVHRGGKVGRVKAHRTLVKYTDINHAQHFAGVVRPEEQVYVTEKIHGANARYGWLPAESLSPWRRLWYWAKRLVGRGSAYDGQDFIVGSHNVELSNDWHRNVWRDVADRFGLSHKGKITPNTVFYGEVYGPGIQPGFDYCLDKPNVVFFDVMVYLNGEGKYLDYGKAKTMVQAAGLQFVPEIMEVDAPCAFGAVDLERVSEGQSFLAHSNSMQRDGSSFDPTQYIREGVVVHLAEERWSPALGRVILKAINPEYSARKLKAEEKGKWAEVQEDSVGDGDGGKECM